MNLIVFPYDCDNYYFRPDTTMVHEARDFYCPDIITVLEAAPCICIRICKSGKAISERFARRIMMQSASESLFMRQYSGRGRAFCLNPKLDI